MPTGRQLPAVTKTGTTHNRSNTQSPWHWLRELERETRELKMENEFLKKAAAYFAKDHR
jgi:transposase-like protein